jgi:hypothetical protein
VLVTSRSDLAHVCLLFSYLDWVSPVPLATYIVSREPCAPIPMANFVHPSLSRERIAPCSALLRVHATQVPSYQFTYFLKPTTPVHISTHYTNHMTNGYLCFFVPLWLVHASLLGISASVFDTFTTLDVSKLDMYLRTLECTIMSSGTPPLANDSPLLSCVTF